MSFFRVQVTRESHHYSQDIEEREEGGTPAIVESIRAGLTFKLKDVSDSSHYSVLATQNGETQTPVLDLFRGQTIHLFLLSKFMSLLIHTYSNWDTCWWYSQNVV